MSRLCVYFFFFFFFFQAEDGIRDHCVTGVQTCALPIFRRPHLARHRHPHLSSGRLRAPADRARRRGSRPTRRRTRTGRSEERRVGKECRSRWAQDHKKKKETKAGTVNAIAANTTSATQ